MVRNISTVFILLLSAALLPNCLWADTADDYYREANSFFAQKDYQRAFDAYQGAIPYDVDPYRAYLGMGNCQFFLNNKEKAVEFLQKSDDLHKDEKVEAFIKKVRSSIPPPKTALFTKSEDLLRDKKYKEAIPILKEIEQYEGTNLKAFYDLGYCYYATGDKPMAAINFAYYVNKTNDSAVTALVDKMRGQLTEDERDWLDGQVQLGPPFSAPFHPMGIGIRFEPTYQFVSLKDFNNFNTELQTKAGQAGSSDPGLSLILNTPPGGLSIELNPYVQVSDDMELGLTFGTLFIGQMDASYTSNNNPNGGDGAISYSVLAVGLSLRSEMVRLYRNKVKFFFEADPSYYMTGVNVANSEVTNATPDTNFDFPMVTGNFTGSGVGARFKLGVDWKPVPNSVVSGFIGYQMAQIQGFGGSGQVPDPNNPGNSIGATGQLMTLQSVTGTKIIFVPTGTIVPGASPLTLDLSGVILGIDMTILL
jgi:tetratricopeptide (TPR) repeat protein